MLCGSSLYPIVNFSLLGVTGFALEYLSVGLNMSLDSLSYKIGRVLLIGYS